ncbi:hypothetical protein LCGC14_2639560 [marine sediment metagenome]|uniref:Uncharacterized protein n=1 Tax=marine sediment metagenome TaxID=412755 RepID=A0A0F9AKC9_9ZZZZ
MNWKPIIGLVLALLLGGCSATIAGKPFDHNLMKRADKAVNDIVEAGNMARGITVDLRPLIDIAWAKYYAGNVALAEGNIEKATTYLEEAIATVSEAAELILEYYQNFSPKPLLQGGALL